MSSIAALREVCRLHGLGTCTERHAVGAARKGDMLRCAVRCMPASCPFCRAPQQRWATPPCQAIFL